MPSNIPPPPPRCLNSCTSCLNRSSCSFSNAAHFLSLKMFGNCDFWVHLMRKVRGISRNYTHFRLSLPPQTAHWSSLLIPQARSPPPHAHRPTVGLAPSSTPNTPTVPSWSACNFPAEKCAKVQRERKNKKYVHIQTVCCQPFANNCQLQNSINILFFPQF